MPVGNGYENRTMKTQTRLVVSWPSRVGRALALTALLSSLPALAATGSWLKDPITGCAVWTEKASGKETISWSGGCQDGKASGRFGDSHWTKVQWRTPIHSSMLNPGQAINV